jgi:hypothetical protein
VSDGDPTVDTAAPAPAPEVVAEPTSQVEPHDPGILPEAIAETPADVQPEPEPEEFDEIEHEGAKHRIPKALKGAFLMQADYTRKTQEVADQRKAIESERESFAKSMEAQREHLKDVGRVHVMDETIEQYSKLDWAALRAQEPERANAMFQDYVQLRDQREQVARKVQGAIEQQAQEAQRSFAKRYEETNAVLAKDIKGWNQDTANKVRDFALGNGISPEQLTVIATTPTLAKLLHKAWLGEQLVSQRTTAAKTADPKVTPQPLVPVKGSGVKPIPDLASADMETYVAVRKKQGFGRPR